MNTFLWGLIAVLQPIEPPPSSVLAMAAELGLSPRVLAAAGATSEHAESVFTLLSGEAELRQSLGSITQDLDSKLRDAHAYLEVLEGSPRDSEALAGYAACRSTMATLKQQRLGVLEDLREAIDAELPAVVWEIAASARDHGMFMSPVGFRRSEPIVADIGTIRSAFARKTEAESRGESVDSATIGILAGVASDEGVQAANSGLANHLEGVKTVFREQEEIGGGGE